MDFKSQLCLNQFHVKAGGPPLHIYIYIYIYININKYIYIYIFFFLHVVFSDIVVLGRVRTEGPLHQNISLCFNAEGSCHRRHRSVLLNFVLAPHDSQASLHSSSLNSFNRSFVVIVFFTSFFRSRGSASRLKVLPLRGPFGDGGSLGLRRHLRPRVASRD